MPLSNTVQTNPINLNRNITVGISLPFNKPSAFRSTYDFKQQIKFNLVNLLLTNRGERVYNPDFGTDIRKQIFNQMVEGTFEALSDDISSTIAAYIPEITVEKLTVTPGPVYNNNAVVVDLTYRINISNESDTITINFE
jgi:phage baseplate assembly protein W